ncbi:uncharacterized protein LOC142322611 [Lycorma delicatula]|uniref:uncharacterized protein LOC142322611 n=1 Tax=Lycorma delicatula TaxID=130591 RepID=UPI003F517603
MTDICHNHLDYGTLFLVLLSLAKLSHTEESEKLYLKSGIHEVPIYAGAASSLDPLIQRRNDFFLKAGKSVPRIGRRNDNYIKSSADWFIPQTETLDQTTNTDAHQVSRRNDFFFKAHKTIPRIGRRNEKGINDWRSISSTAVQEDVNEVIPKLTKKDGTITSMDEGEAVAVWPWFRNPEMFSSYQKKKDKQNFSGNHPWSDDSYTLSELKGTSLVSKESDC